MRRWGLLLRLLREDEDRFRGGTDERLARPRMTGDGHPYLWRGLKFKVGSLFGTDEHPARPRMTRDGHPYLLETSDRATPQAF